MAIAKEANARHILVRPLSRYYLTAARKKGLLMGFASQPEEQMAPAFSVLLDCLQDALPADAPAPGGRRKTKRPNLRRGVIGEPDIRYQAGVAYQASIAARSFLMAFFPADAHALRRRRSGRPVPEAWTCCLRPASGRGMMSWLRSSRPCIASVSLFAACSSQLSSSMPSAKLDVLSCR